MIGKSLPQEHKELSTGIVFPHVLKNAMIFIGSGVRIKAVFVKIYAVATYMDPMTLSTLRMNHNTQQQQQQQQQVESCNTPTTTIQSIIETASTLLKQQVVESYNTCDITKSLLDPTNHRTIRIIMYHAVSMDTFTAAIKDAIMPKMNGHEDLKKVEEFFKTISTATDDLKEGDTMDLTISSDSLLYTSKMGNQHTITSLAFCQAICQVYYSGAESISPSHFESVRLAISQNITT